MKEVSIIGVDLAKQVFQLRGAIVDGEVVFRKKLSRKQFVAFMEAHPRCRVAMEACATAHHWARTLMGFGHEVRLIAPKFVKPYVKTQKNGMADAEAIVEAATRPTMRFIEIKTVEHQGLGMVFRSRDLLVGQRTQTINALRGHLAEFGLIAVRAERTLRSCDRCWTMRMERQTFRLPCARWRNFAWTRSPTCLGASRRSTLRYRRPAGDRVFPPACRGCPVLVL